MYTYSKEEGVTILVDQSTNQKSYAPIVITLSVIVNAIILFLFFGPVGYEGELHFDVTILPMLNAIFNSFTFVFLLAALFSIIKKNVKMHRGFILAGAVLAFLHHLERRGGGQVDIGHRRVRRLRQPAQPRAAEPDPADPLPVGERGGHRRAEPSESLERLSQRPEVAPVMCHVSKYVAHATHNVRAAHSVPT